MSKIYISLQMSKHCKIVIHTYARLSGALWSTGMFKIDCKSTFHGQTNRLSGRHVVTG